MLAVDIRGAHKHYGKAKALNGVSIKVEQGKIFGFLGPNGAGKTTTIRCMMDFIRPSSGSVKLLGLDAHDDSVDLKKRIGYLPAAAYMYGNWTGKDHLKFVSQLRGTKIDTELVTKLGLNTRAKVKHLSTGNQQKLAIALAFAGNPELVILDEPSKGLDPLLQNFLYNMLVEYRQAGGTVFMSSHNLGEVEKICDSIAVIRKGKIYVEETLSKLRQKSIHNISATFGRTVTPEQFEAPGVTVLHNSGQSVSLRVQGDIAKIMQAITSLPLKDLEVTHASLEELFLEMDK